MKRLRIFLPILCIIFGLSCSNNDPGDLKSTFTVAKSADQAAAEAEQESPNMEKLSKDGKTSDDDEGIPGYLSNPDKFNVSEDNGLLTISAEPSAVVQVNPKGTFVSIWQISEEFVNESDRVIRSGAAANAVFVSSFILGPDGSFEGAVEAPGRNQLIIVSFDISDSPAALDFVDDRRNTYAGIMIEKQNRPGGPPGSRRSSYEIEGLFASDPEKLQALGIDTTKNIRDQLIDRRERISRR